MTQADLRKTLCSAALAVLASLAFGSPEASAASNLARSPSAGENAQPPRSVRFIKAPSEETAAARAKRLKRECKGRPNAGMCLGHAR